MVPRGHQPCRPSPESVDIPRTCGSGFNSGLPYGHRRFTSRSQSAVRTVCGVDRYPRSTAMTAPTPGSLLYSFFEDYLKVQKGLRTASLRSYRDALRLFMHFVATDTRRRISRLSLADLT